jgi:hypothetical protein
MARQLRPLAIALAAVMIGGARPCAGQVVTQSRTIQLHVRVLPRDGAALSPFAAPATPGQSRLAGEPRAILDAGTARALAMRGVRLDVLAADGTIQPLDAARAVAITAPRTPSPDELSLLVRAVHPDASAGGDEEIPVRVELSRPWGDGLAKWIVQGSVHPSSGQVRLGLAQ